MLAGRPGAVLHNPAQGASPAVQASVIARRGAGMTRALHPGGDPDALDGAQLYDRVLQQAGGRQVEALARQPERAALCVALYRSPPYDLQVPAMPVSRLSVTLTGARVFGSLAGERARHYETPRHRLYLMPAGAEARWRKDAPSRHLTLYFHPETLAGDGVGADPLLAAPLFNQPAAGLGGLVDALVAELEGDAPHAAEAADSLSRLLLVKLSRMQGALLSRAGALPPLQLARLRDFVAAHLAERLLVADLAAVVGLTPSHFAHAFSTQAGMPPHQYVLEMRLARARELLAHSTLSLAEVAAACGFASQQHLTSQMRRRGGITPGRYRQLHQAR